MTPYTFDKVITTVGANEVAALDFPGRCTIKQAQVLNLDAAATATADFYSRAFATDAINIARIESGTGAKAYVVLKDWLPVRVGDSVTIAGTSGYNATHRVTRVDDTPSESPYATTPARAILLATAFGAAEGEGGTAQTVVPTAQQPLYKVAGITIGSAGAVITTAAEFVYQNQDPPMKRNIGVPRKLYVKLALAGSYRIVIRAVESVAMGG